ELAACLGALASDEGGVTAALAFAIAEPFPLVGAIGDECAAVLASPAPIFPFPLTHGCALPFIFSATDRPPLHCREQNRCSGVADRNQAPHASHCRGAAAARRRSREARARSRAPPRMWASAC